MSETFEFQREHDGSLDLSAAVFQALGAASMCWSEGPSGVFESDIAKEIGEALLAFIAACSQCASVRLDAPSQLHDEEELIQSAAFAALSPWSNDTLDGDAWRDDAADQVRDAVLTALADNGLSIVLTADVVGVIDEIDRLTAKLASGINLTRGIPSNSAGGNYPTAPPIQNNAGAISINIHEPIEDRFASGIAAGFQEGRRRG